MSTTPLLDLPYLAAGQAQKHVTVNETLRRLDALIHITVASRGLGAPPTAPSEGERYLLPATPSGVWVGKAGQIAAWQDGGWAFYEAGLGWAVYVEDESRLLVKHAGGWGRVGADPETLPKLGINAPADETNRFVAAATATLLTHVGNGHQLKLNKATSNDTASLVFQTGFSGKVEIGMAGDDRFSLKQSEDGQNWRTTMTVLPDGSCGFGTNSPFGSFEVQQTIGRFTITTSDPASTHGAGILAYVKRQPQAADERLGFFVFGWNESQFTQRNAAAISAFSEGAWSPGVSHPTYMRFDTTEQNGSGRSERMRIAANGNIGIGTSSPSTRLHVEGAIRPGSHTVAGLPNAATSGAGAIVFVSNAAGGSVLAFSDGTNWRRISDRAIVTA